VKEELLFVLLLALVLASLVKTRLEALHVGISAKLRWLHRVIIYGVARAGVMF